MTGPNCSTWNETLREWLIDSEAFEAVPQIEFPSENFPGRIQIPPTQASPGQLSSIFRAMLQTGSAKWNEVA